MRYAAQASLITTPKWLCMLLLLCNEQIIISQGSEFTNVEMGILETAVEDATIDVARSDPGNMTIVLTRSGIRKNPPQHTKFPMAAEIIGRESNVNLRAYDILVNRHGIPRERALRLLARRASSSEFCGPPSTNCNLFPTNVRTIDGSCNNLLHPTWGRALTAFNRLLNQSYSDGFGAPRGARANKLPNVRLVSTTIHPDLIHPDTTITNMVPQMGQFVDHDLTLTPEADKKCCTTDSGYIDCFSIDIPKNDSFFSTLKSVNKNSRRCMDFTRSTPFCFPTSTGIREQFNILTAYLDLSQVYGSDDERAKQLRAHTKGLMRVHEENQKLLPTVAEVEAATLTKIEFMGKFLAGDERVNEMPALAVMHTLWVREHNRVAKEIGLLRPEWTDEMIFQQARRIVIAQWQNIVFSEFLPVVLGLDTMDKYGLTLEDGFSTYDPNVDATITNSFATAAYRFGHTLINGIVQLFKDLVRVGSYKLSDNFFESEQLEQMNGQGYDLILGGLMIQNAQTYDRHVTDQLTNHLLQRRPAVFGGDLIARNLHRGRDHGIRPYNDYRVVCELLPLTSWGRRPKEILRETWKKLRELYSSPLDIDLFTGGIAEVPAVGAVSGATFNCLKAIQFKKLKDGDRFFFTHSDQDSSFELDHLEAIRRRTLGDVICENSQVERTPRNVFRTFTTSDSNENPLLACSDPIRQRLPEELFIHQL